MGKLQRFFSAPKGKAAGPAPVTSQTLQAEYTQLCCEEGDIRFKRLQQDRRLKEMDTRRFELERELKIVHAREMAEAAKKSAHEAKKKADESTLPTAPPPPDAPEANA